MLLTLVHLQLDNTGGLNAASNIFNDTAPTSTYLVLERHKANYSGDNLIAYVFAEKKGFSKIGVYTGNNNTNGAFVYTGFKPGFLMIKNYGASGQSWNIHDNERLGSNLRNYQLYANSGSSEDTNERLDLLSNGFKIRTTSGDNNHVSGYFYMAFAEEPLVSSNNIPATAR